MCVILVIKHPFLKAMQTKHDSWTEKGYFNMPKIACEENKKKIIAKYLDRYC
jgi:hypothetical protein